MPNKKNRIILVIIFLAVSISLSFFIKNNVFSNNNNISKLADVLKKHVIYFSDKIGDRSVYQYKNLKKAADYIEKYFKKNKIEYKSQYYYVQGNKKVKNIIAAIKGNELSKEVIVVGAHYDTYFNPGADDNASGVAGVLELAKLLKSKKYKRTIKLVAFVNEEPPFFKTANMGSMVYAKKAKEAKEQIKAAVILEMIGYFTQKPDSQEYPAILSLFYPDKGNYLAIVSNTDNSSLVNKVYKRFKKHSSFPVEKLTAPAALKGVDFSDHWSFWQYDYPAVMVTDTAFFRNKNYHKKSDTYDTLDYNSMAKVVNGVFKVIEDLANGS